MKAEKVAVSKLKPYHNNPRNNKKAIDPVAESIRQCGYCSPIVVDEDYIVLAGHTRLQAIKKLGWKEVEVIVREGMTEEQKRKYRLLDNKTGEIASWDYEVLQEELEGLDFEGLDLDWGTEYKSDNLIELDNREYEEEDFGDEHFDYECPHCGFMFNEKDK